MANTYIDLVVFEYVFIFTGISF